MPRGSSRSSGPQNPPSGAPSVGRSAAATVGGPPALWMKGSRRRITNDGRIKEDEGDNDGRIKEDEGVCPCGFRVRGKTTKAIIPQSRASHRLDESVVALWTDLKTRGKDHHPSVQAARSLEMRPSLRPLHLKGRRCTKGPSRGAPAAPRACGRARRPRQRGPSREGAPRGPAVEGRTEGRGLELMMPLMGPLLSSTLPKPKHGRLARHHRGWRKQAAAHHAESA